MRRFQDRCLAAGLAVPVWLFAVMPCFAQMGAAGPTDVNGAARRNLRGPAATKTEPAPPVLPGTKAAVDPAAPTLSPADMSPTDALFDAINRGDLAASRDAVNRGANLDVRNVLGLTPLELSVDLGRNEISFLLLSFRPEDASHGRDAAKAARSGSMPREAALPRRVARTREAAEPMETIAPASPRLHAGGGGAAVPGAGFLGFDSGVRAR